MLSCAREAVSPVKHTSCLVTITLGEKYATIHCSMHIMLSPACQSQKDKKAGSVVDKVSEICNSPSVYQSTNQQ